MMDEKTENYIRLLLVLIRVGMLVCKGIIEKELKLEDAALHVVLERRKKELTTKLLNHQKPILFPKNGNPNINDFDLSLLTFVLQNALNISKIDKEHVKVIKETRNKLAHNSTASIENAKYKTLKKNLEDALERLYLGLDVSLRTECSTLIQKLTSEPFDEATALKYIKELRNEDEMLRDLEEMLEEHSIRIVQEIQATEKRIQEALTEIQATVTYGFKNLQAPPPDVKMQRPEMDKTEDMGICERHKERISFFCKTDNTLCCHTCKKEQHEKCKSIEPISEEIFEWKCNPALEIQRLQTEARLLNNWISSVEKANEEGEKNISAKFDEQKTAFLRQISKEEKSLKQKEKIVRNNTSIEIEGNRRNCDDFIAKTEQAKLSLINMATSDKKTENVNAKLTLQKFTNELISFSEIHLASFSFDDCNFEWNFDHSEWTQKLVSPEESPVQLSQISSFESKPSKDNGNEKGPYFSGMDYLPDVRLIVVDNNNREFVVFNEKLEKVGSHQFTYYPQSVVAVSEEEVAITTGGLYKIDFLRVSKANKITFLRTCQVTADYDSICLKDYGHFVAATINESTPFRIVSLSGKESDFNFPDKKDPKDKIKCTYIRNRQKVVVSENKNHAVSLYDTATKKKVVVDNDVRIVKPGGIAVGPFDCIFVCSSMRNSIVQISPSGHILTSHQLDMVSPHTICFSQDKTKLAVANNVVGKQQLQVFEVVI